MAIFKRRPKITLLTPRAIHAGRPFEVTVVLHCKVPVTADEVRIDLSGASVWYSRGKHGRHRHTEPFLGERAVVWTGGELTAGEHRFAARFALHPQLPGSYGGQSIQIEYTVLVRVHIPWWPDAKEEFQLHVNAAPTAPVDRPAVFASSADGPQGRKAYFELSTATTELVGGNRLPLAASLTNADHNRYRGLVLDLVAVESTDHWMNRGVVRRRLVRFELPLEQVVDGQAVPFELRVPTIVVPAFTTRRIALAWEIQACADIALGFDPELTMPVTVRVIEPTETLPAMQAPPAVGEERVDLVWREVATAHGFDYVAGALVRSYDDGASARIWREKPGRRGMTMCAEIMFPDLGIGLAIGRGDALRARDREQQALLREWIGESVAAASAIEVSDRVVRCERRGNATRRKNVSELAGEVERLVQAIASARAGLPPPAPLAGEIAAWRRAAAQLDAVLESAGPTLRGGRDGARWSLGIGWDADDTARQIVLRVVPPQPIDTRHHRRWLAGKGQGAPPDDPAAARLCDGARSFEVARDQVCLSLDRAGTSLEHAVHRLGELVAHSIALCRPADASVYR